MNMKKGISDESLMIVFFLFIAFLGMLVWFASVQDQFSRFGRVTIEKEEVIFLPERLEYEGKIYELIKDFCTNRDGTGECQELLVGEVETDSTVDAYNASMSLGQEYTFARNNLLLFVVRLYTNSNGDALRFRYVDGTSFIDIFRLFLSSNIEVYENAYIPSGSFTTNTFTILTIVPEGIEFQFEAFTIGIYVEERSQ